MGSDPAGSHVLGACGMRAAAGRGDGLWRRYDYAEQYAGFGAYGQWCVRDAQFGQRCQPRQPQPGERHDDPSAGCKYGWSAYGQRAVLAWQSPGPVCGGGHARHGQLFRHAGRRRRWAPAGGHGANGGHDGTGGRPGQRPECAGQPAGRTTADTGARGGEFRVPCGGAGEIEHWAQHTVG